jgi:hypothetical protein
MRMLKKSLKACTVSSSCQQAAGSSVPPTVLMRLAMGSGKLGYSSSDHQIVPATDICPLLLKRHGAVITRVINQLVDTEVKRVQRLVSSIG